MNEFCSNTGYHRKYAIRLLNGPRPERRWKPRKRQPGLSYGAETLAVLTAVWEANGCEKAARSANVEIAKRFPRSHSRNNNKPSVTFQMSRQPQLRLHS